MITCNYENCNRLARSRGYCETHYRYLRESGILQRKNAFATRKKKHDSAGYERKRKEMLELMPKHEKEYHGLIIKAVPTNVIYPRFTTVVMRKPENELILCFSSAIQHSEPSDAINEGISMVDNYLKSKGCIK